MSIPIVIAGGLALVLGYWHSALIDRALRRRYPHWTALQRDAVRLSIALGSIALILWLRAE